MTNLTNTILNVKEDSQKELIELEKELSDKIAEVNEKADEKISK